MAGQAFGAMLAANQLGVDATSDLALAEADDALRELMNITCGSVIRRFGLATDQRLHMSLPTVEAVEDVLQWKNFIAMPGVSVLDADGQLIAFQLAGLD
jgi:hypothetical protein